MAVRVDFSDAIESGLKERKTWQWKYEKEYLCQTILQICRKVVCCARMEEASDIESEAGDADGMLVESMVVKMLFTFWTNTFENSCERTAISELGGGGYC